MPKLGALQLPLPGAAQTVGGVSVVLGLVGLGSAVVAELHSLGSAAFDALSEDVHEVAQDLEYRLRVGCRKESERLRASLSEVAAGARAAAMAYELSADPQLAFSLRVREEVVDIFNGFSAVVSRNPLPEKDMVVGTRVAMSDDCLKTKGRAGPLNPGDVGTIVKVFKSSHVEVKLDDSGETRWYVRYLLCCQVGSLRFLRLTGSLRRTQSSSSRQLEVFFCLVPLPVTAVLCFASSFIAFPSETHT
jgi:hypothetical protein